MSEKNRPHAEVKAAAAFWIMENRPIIESMVEAGHTYPKIAEAVAQGIGVESFPETALRPIFKVGGLPTPTIRSRTPNEHTSAKRLAELIDAAYEKIGKLEMRVSALEIAQAKQSGNLC